MVRLDKQCVYICMKASLFVQAIGGRQLWLSDNAAAAAAQRTPACCLIEPPSTGHGLVEKRQIIIILIRQGSYQTSPWGVLCRRERLSSKFHGKWKLINRSQLSSVTDRNSIQGFGGLEMPDATITSETNLANFNKNDRPCLPFLVIFHIFGTKIGFVFTK